jgi:hypothetical protein
MSITGYHKGRESINPIKSTKGHYQSSNFKFKDSPLGGEVQARHIGGQSVQTKGPEEVHDRFRLLCLSSPVTTQPLPPDRQIRRLWGDYSALKEASYYASGLDLAIQAEQAE